MIMPAAVPATYRARPRPDIVRLGATQANWVHMPVSLPFDTIVVRMSTSGDSLSSVLSKARSQPVTSLCVICNSPCGCILQCVLLERALLLYAPCAPDTQPTWTTACRYKGAAAFLVLGLKNAVQFAVYEPTKRWQIARNAGSALTPLQAFLHGAFSRLVSDTVLFPARRAKVLQQRGHLSDGTSKVASNPTMVRRHSFGQREPPITSSETIRTCGRLVLLLAACYMQPVSRCLTRLLALRSVDLQLGVLGRVVREKGLLAVFDGLGPELVRGMLSGALMLMVKEYIDAIVMGAIIGRG